MVDPFIWLLLLCITMFLGSFLAGCIPLSTKLSETKLRNLTALGVGLLIGTALVIIIPEGIETLYSSNAVTNVRNHTESMLQQHVTTASSAMHSDTTHTTPTPVWQEDTGLQKRQPHKHEEDEEHKSTEHSTIGLAMIVGFAMMFVVDQVSSLHVHGSSSSTHHHHEYSELSLMDGNGSASTSTSHGNGNGSPEQRSRSPTSKSITPTIGLIVHAAADGIALGASATHPELSMVVFLAIMLHKAPSAFALTTVLLAEGLSRVSVRRHLLIFSLSAPTGAIGTYMLLHVFWSSSTTSTDLAYWTGVLLVFSGGTFLYVAMHALQELRPSSPSHAEKLSGSQVGAILGGMFLPIVLNVAHSH
ncbi:Zinc/iron permease [Lichtheimia hyalospora FSU 10163]|nr:Zinc/iron permease [Lichtheimia hyalospora FSU 10163]